MNCESGVKLKKLKDCPQFLDKASHWFGSKWDVPVAAYRESMADCLKQEGGIPQWYIVLNERQEIVAGAGVIENDFHERKELTPNVCALFVEDPYRKKGMAKYILDFIRRDLKDSGFLKLYLLTDHMGFYEKCGWNFLGLVTGEDKATGRMYVAETLY